MKIDSFTEIEAWKQARLFVANVYDIFSQGNSQKDFGFRDQIQRASVSIMSNIAEGFDSGSKKSFIQFLTYSYRSASEVESLLFVALDIHYIDVNQHNELMSKLNSIKKLIGGFIRHLKNSEHTN
ncbi:MAG TPA: four helix bundle protein [Candidatus Cloacimonas sp.]|nr:four helix bundle protein [Candidatus Cloacimonas sp.]